MELIFNTRLGVYVVGGQDDRYFLDGWYYRLAGNGWECAVCLDKNWIAVDYSKVPPGLLAQHHPSGKKKARGHASSR
jgi:hypothetical protein